MNNFLSSWRVLLEQEDPTRGECRPCKGGLKLPSDPLSEQSAQPLGILVVAPWTELLGMRIRELFCFQQARDVPPASFHGNADTLSKRVIAPPRAARMSRSPGVPWSDIQYPWEGAPKESIYRKYTGIVTEFSRMTCSYVRILKVDNERKTLNCDPSLKFEGLQKSLENLPLPHTIIIICASKCYPGKSLLW